MSKKELRSWNFSRRSIKLNKVKRNLDLKPKLDDFDRRIQRIKVVQRQNELNNAKETLKLFLLRVSA